MLQNRVVNKLSTILSILSITSQFLTHKISSFIPSCKTLHKKIFRARAVNNASHALLDSYIHTNYLLFC